MSAFELPHGDFCCHRSRTEKGRKLLKAQYCNEDPLVRKQIQPALGLNLVNILTQNIFETSKQESDQNEREAGGAVS